MNLKQLMVALLAAGAGGAFAQSSVTIGGIADTAVRSVANQGSSSVQSLVSGANNTSRLYFRGNEDLGGGLSAGFWIESGIAFDTGTSTGGTQFFDRRATLMLASRSVGEMRLGRDYVPTYTLWSRHDPFTHVGVAGSNNFTSAAQQGPVRNAFGSNPNTTVRASNSLQYLLPGGWAGVEGGLMVAAGEGRSEPTPSTRTMPISSASGPCTTCRREPPCTLRLRVSTTTAVPASSFQAGRRSAGAAGLPAGRLASDTTFELRSTSGARSISDRSRGANSRIGCAISNRTPSRT